MKAITGLLFASSITSFVFQRGGNPSLKICPPLRNIFENQMPSFVEDPIFKIEESLTKRVIKVEKSIKRPLSANHFKTNSLLERVSLKEKYLLQIASGSKTVEGRINTGRFLKNKEGDFIIFFCQTRQVCCRIAKIVKYCSFREMLQTEGVKCCLPDVSTIENGVAIYHAIPGYRKKAARFGVLAIHVQLQN